MPDDKSKNGTNDQGGQQQPNGGGSGDAEQRINELTGKLKDKDDEVAKANAKAFEAEFQLGFGPVATTYPHAKEFEADIKKTAQEKGLSVQAATAAVLAEKGKLITADQIKANDAAAGGGMGGGSSNTVIPETGKKTPEQMTQDERLAELRAAEQRGDIILS